MKTARHCVTNDNMGPLVLEVLDNARKSLGEADSCLGDAHAILKGYIAVRAEESLPPPPAAAQSPAPGSVPEAPPEMDQ